MDIRISRGRLKNRRFKNVPAVHRKTNFTPSKLKQAVFDRLLTRIDPEEYLFVDLFAGSGQMGMEAFSNGFDDILFIEKDAARTAFIRQCKEQWLTENEAGRVHVYTTDFESALRKLDYNRPMVIFLDPPYGIKRGGRPLVVHIWAKFLAARLKPPFWIFIQTEAIGADKILSALTEVPWKGLENAPSEADDSPELWQQTNYANQALFELENLATMQ